MRLFKKKNKFQKFDFYDEEKSYRFINEQLYGVENTDTLVNALFAKKVGYFPDVEKPRSLNEKILWLNKYYHEPLEMKCADKYLVKDYIKEKLGRDDLTARTIASYDSVYDIDLEKLPKSFVLKVNWGCGDTQVVEVIDKATANIDYIRAKLDNSLLPWNNCYYATFDWAYKNMKPQIYAEEYLEFGKGAPDDYKVYCFNGKPVMILVISERFGKKKIKKTFLDLDWNVLSFGRPKADKDKSVQKPACFDEMIEISRKLAQPFPLLRVDFYVVNGKPVIGEMTFHPGSGFEPFEPREWDYKLGEWLKLPDVKK